MSALGQKQTWTVHQLMSALPPKADMCSALAHVCFGPKADIQDDVNEKERPPCGGLPKVMSRLRSRSSSCPRLRCLGFLNGLCGVADHVQHSMRLGEHRNMT
jgi:hypothetical protein